MPNTNAYEAVVHEKKNFIGFCYIYLYQSMSFQSVAICDSRDFIWTHLNLLVLRMFYAKYQCIWSSGSWEEDLSKFVKMFHFLVP